MKVWYSVYGAGQDGIVRLLARVRSLGCAQIVAQASRQAGYQNVKVQ